MPEQIRNRWLISNETLAALPLETSLNRLNNLLPTVHLDYSDPAKSRLTINIPARNQQRPVLWPEGIEWKPGEQKLDIYTEYFKISRSWDGTETIYRIPKPEQKIPLKAKPRMWYCPKERVHMCQKGLVRGRGTTRHGAYHDLQTKLKDLT